MEVANLTSDAAELTPADIAATSSVVDQLTTEAIENPQVCILLQSMLMHKFPSFSRSGMITLKSLITSSKLIQKLFLKAILSHVLHKGKLILFYECEDS